MNYQPCHLFSFNISYRFALIIFFLLCGVANAQEKNDYLPPTPTAAALGKYVDAPISLATGTPEISIPIYEISIGNFKLPISLSYHAGGFRVEEESSWVGLGWSLQAGGVITRTIRGGADSGTRDAFFNNYTGQELSTQGGQSYKDLFRLAQFHPDGMPDLYIYNFTGHSGKFININGVKLLPKKPILVTPGSLSFEIIDEQGNKYFFSEIESAKTRSGTTVATNEKISWYLSSITTPTNDVINFYYKSTEFFQSVNISESKSYKQLITGRWESESISANSFTTTLYGKELERITWSQGSVELYSAYDREDISKPQGSAGALRLKTIKVMDKAGKINKMFHLQHGYFGPAASTNPLTKRLKLLSVVEDLQPEVDFALSSTLKSYKFEYNSGIELPSKNSKSQDHWGYYNGKSNTSLVPPMYNGPTIGDECGSISDINLEPTRDTDTTMVKACLLTKMNYPTGGFTKYVYESHDYGFIGNAPVPQKNVRTNVDADNALVSAYTNNSNYTPSTRSTHTETFTINDAQCAKIWINILYPPLWEDGSLSQAKIELFKGGSLIKHFKQTDNGDNFLSLTPGQYTLVATGTMNGSTASAIAYYEDFDILTTMKRYAGGVRVKKIIENDGLGSNIVRRITYNSNNNPVISSGSLLEEPNYYKWYHTWYQPPTSEGDPEPDWCVFSDIYHLSVTSSSQIALGGGNHISYNEVQVLYGENGENGKTISTFTTFSNLTHGTESDVSWRRGLLLTTTEYNNAGAKLRFNQNEYGFITQDLYYGLTVEDTGNHPCATQNNAGAFDVHYRQTISILSSELYALKSSYTEEYVQGGNPLKSYTNYYYDNVTHLQPTRIVNTLNNKKLITQSSYPEDYINTTGFVADLKSAHIIVPLERITWQENLTGTNTGILEGQLFIYKAGGRGLLEEVKSLELSKPLGYNAFKFANRNMGVLPPNDLSGSYDPFSGYVSKSTITYDGYFNPIQVISQNGIPTSYIWGYQNDFPIAKVTNANNNKIAYTGFENDSEGNWDAYNSNSSNARTGKKGYIGNLTKSNIPTDTYLITLWVKDATGTPTIANLTPKEISEAIDGWKLFRWEASLSGQLIISSNGSTIDDVRLCPVNSLMTTIIYDPLKGPLSFTDSNNVISYYEYDLTGRLKNIRDNRRNILKHFDYQYFPN